MRTRPQHAGVLLWVTFNILISLVFGWIDNVTKRDSLCHRVWPSTEGRWTDYPPYWTLPNCPTQHFPRTLIQKCMQNRTMYVIGNSVPRQAAFDLIELLGGGSTDREHQKEECPKHAGEWPSSCRNEYAGIKFKYLYIQWMDGYNYTNSSGFPYFFQRVFDEETQNYTVITDRLPNARPGYGVNKDEVPLSPGFMKDLYFRHDVCDSQEMRGCLAKFLDGSDENDILLFTVGMSFPIPDKDEVSRQKEQVLKDGVPAVDMTSFLVASAVNFKSHLAALFKGQVFRVTMAPAHKNKFARGQTPYWLRTDKVLWSLWRPGSEPRPWYTIDQWAINGDRFHYYNDLVHFNGVLTHAMLYQVFNLLCPGGGLDKTYTHTIFRSNDTYYSWVSEDNTYIPIELDANYTIPNYLSTLQVTTLTPELELLFTASDKPKIPLLNNKAVKVNGDKQVYWVKDGMKRRFMSSAAFFNHGFQDFNEILAMPLEFLECIPLGPDVKDTE
jgi:hypothetical protein